jgi:hypothetical protein
MRTSQLCTPEASALLGERVNSTNVNKNRVCSKCDK